MRPNRHATSLSRLAAWLLLVCACAVPATGMLLPNTAPAELAGEILDPVDDREARRQRAQAPRPQRAEAYTTVRSTRFSAAASRGPLVAQREATPHAPPSIRALPAPTPA